MKLPRGVTGFGEPQPDPACDIKAFTAACHEAARALAGRIEDVRAVNTGTLTSFHVAVVSLKNRGRLRVLCNAYAPIIAFTRADDPPGTIGFVDAPEFSEVWPGYAVLSKARAEAVPDEDTLSMLADVEVKQAKYWKPQRVGDFVFNFWD